MRDAIKLSADGNRHTITASPTAPDTAACPVCGGLVQKRHRRRMDGDITYFYRHTDDTNPDCPRRYHPAN